MLPGVLRRHPERHVSHGTEQHRSAGRAVAQTTAHRRRHHGPGRHRRPRCRVRQPGAGQPGFSCPGPGGHPRRPRPVARRGPRGRPRVRRAGGGERGDERHRHRPRHRGLHAAGRGVRPVGGQPDARAVRRVHAAERGQRDHRALQHPRRAGRRRDHRAARRHGQRRPPPDHDAHVAVRLALQPVPVLQRPERRPAAPGLVDHRVHLRPGRDDARAGDHRRRSGRTTSTTSSACCSAGPTGRATRCG